MNPKLHLSFESASILKHNSGYLDFDTHIKIQGLGSISKAYTKHKKGLILHSTLILSQEGLPLGLTSQQCWARIARDEGAEEKARGHSYFYSK